MTTMGATTTLLLVLATTSALFFDLAAARCRVMMFMPGHLEPLDGSAGLNGVATEKDGNIQVLDATKTSFPGAGKRVHVLFGTKPAYKWYTAVKAVSDAPPANIAHDSDLNYYVINGPSGKTILTAQWANTVKLTAPANIKAKEMVWIALINFATGASCDVLSVYINEEPSFRSGPMRYAGYKGKAVLIAVENRSQQKFRLDLKVIDTSVGNAANARLFYGHGTFENAEVAMDVHFQVTGKALTSGTAIVSAAGFVYKDFAGSNAKLAAKADDVTLTNPEGDAHSLGWVAAYDPTIRKFAFYQKMTHMGDGFHNGKLMMGTSGDATAVGLEGTIVFASRGDDEFLLYLPKVKDRSGQNAIRGFYGKKPWSDDMEKALDAIPSVAVDDAPNEIYLSPTAAWDVTSFTDDTVSLTVKEFDLKSGDTCGMVKWVALRQTAGDKQYLAHRDMTKKM